MALSRAWGVSSLSGLLYSLPGPSHRTSSFPALPIAKRRLAQARGSRLDGAARPTVPGVRTREDSCLSRAVAVLHAPHDHTYTHHTYVSNWLAAFHRFASNHRLSAVMSHDKTGSSLCTGGNFVILPNVNTTISDDPENASPAWMDKTRNLIRSLVGGNATSSIIEGPSTPSDRSSRTDIRCPESGPLIGRRLLCYPEI